MAGVNATGGEVIAEKRPLLEYMEAGCKPPENWRIGTEHEKFAYRRGDLRPLEYGGAGGVRALLEGLTRFGWEMVLENGNPIALTKSDLSSITLEPGGQIELSGAPLETVHQTCDEVTGHLKQVKAIAGDMDIGFLGLGYNPKWSAADIPWMPKGRYAIMKKHMPKRGGLGLEMMLATCTVQVNLDFDSEATMVRMFRVALALQSIATAMWANSPFKKGVPTGYLSYRSHIWTDTDPDRTGVLDFVFEDGFGFERYVDYLLDVPMYFVYRDGAYIDASGHSFRDFMAGKLQVLPGERPTLKDWEDHMTTAFPGSSSSWKCAAPTAARGGDCAPCPPSGPGFSTTRRRSTRRGNWSRRGRPRSAPNCAPRCRAWPSRRSLATAPSATSPATPCRSPTRG